MRCLISPSGRSQSRHAIGLAGAGTWRHILLTAARAYNPLQKIAYLGVLFVLIPVVILTGCTMSPTLNAAFPWLVELFGGRPSARSIHFLCATGFAGFITVHLLAVVLAGPFNELRSIITGWYRLPKERSK